ncbi:MAG: ferredoxin [Bacteroidetes bacterium]|nr:MAG: ferredoxin [Bacteroidota bacterium]PIE88301.1 MAG: ferredoxin [Bacteroidota bacterium]
MSNNIFHHAFGVDESICTGCTHCMKACPTQAIRIRHGKAQVMGERCIDCGRCYSVCPVGAFKVEEDDLDDILQYPIKVALLPAVFIGQFPEDISTDQIYQAVRELGFTDVHEVEQSVDFLKHKTLQYQKEEEEDKPHISSFCPAVVRLMQVRFPSLIENIIRLKTPHDLTAELIKDKFIKEGYKDEEIGIFYITPCAAKIAAVKSPVGEAKSVINGVINMDHLFNKAMYFIKQADEVIPEKTRSHLGTDAITWSLTTGESRHTTGRSLAIDGINNVTDFLEKIENEEITDVSYLELRACSGSCCGGILCTTNRFLSTERLTKRAEISAKNPQKVGLTHPQNPKTMALLEEKIRVNEIEPRPLRLDTDIGKALKKIERIRELMCFLPGFDCGACGSPTCRALAEDVVQKKANISHCVFMQRKSLLDKTQRRNIIHKIWGKEALHKNCSKKGAKNESI